MQIIKAQKMSYTHGWKCRFFSPKFRVSGIGEMKEGGKMSMEEVSKNFAKN